MKKVRFESPIKGALLYRMDDRECHSPRPFTERQIHTPAPDIYSYPKILPYSNDPMQLFECSNSSPYPTMDRTKLLSQERSPQWSPSNDLELSMLDASNHEPRKPAFSRSILKAAGIENNNADIPRNTKHNDPQTVKPPNVLIKDNDFFIKRDNLGKIHFDINPLQQQVNKLTLDKENNPFAMKAQMIQMSAVTQPENKMFNTAPSNVMTGDCRCHHCVKIIGHHLPSIDRGLPHQQMRNCSPQYTAESSPSPRYAHCMCGQPPAPKRCSCCDHTDYTPQCTHKTSNPDQHTAPKINAVDKKTWAIEKYEQSKKSESMEVEKQTNVSKEKREPTVADLFKIIKLQNEQLQLLQEKVDKFISASQQQNTAPIQNLMTEHVGIETVGNEQHKISIGVMTSFEMVRTSTIINKEVVKKNENAQLQCNRSQISIKEVLSKTQSPNLNFLDGITPLGKSMPECYTESVLENTGTQHVNEEKTLNEMSLYNIQMDNATTPMISPEQSMYLDVRDYSSSGTDSDDQSNVGWTYYNKVMTHVNGMLQDSDMPSSASALYRNTRQQLQTVQMQIDKTNVSVTKRVKFGDDPFGIHQPHIYAGSTDTSLKMNQLAAKYLKGVPTAPAPPPRPAPRTTTAPIDMSFATRNYMERHKLLQGAQDSSKPASPTEMPRFLDITALKQQPKFL